MACGRSHRRLPAVRPAPPRRLVGVRRGRAGVGRDPRLPRPSLADGLRAVGGRVQPGRPERRGGALAGEQALRDDALALSPLRRRHLQGLHFRLTLELRRRRCGVRRAAHGGDADGPRRRRRLRRLHVDHSKRVGRRRHLRHAAVQQHGAPRLGRAARAHADLLQPVGWRRGAAHRRHVGGRRRRRDHVRAAGPGAGLVKVPPRAGDGHAAGASGRWQPRIDDGRHGELDPRLRVVVDTRGRWRAAAATLGRDERGERLVWRAERIVVGPDQRSGGGCPHGGDGLRVDARLVEHPQPRGGRDGAGRRAPLVCEWPRPLDRRRRLALARGGRHTPVEPPVQDQRGLERAAHAAGQPLRRGGHQRAVARLHRLR